MCVTVQKRSCLPKSLGNDKGLVMWAPHPYPQHGLVPGVWYGNAMITCVNSTFKQTHQMYISFSKISSLYLYTSAIFSSGMSHFFRKNSPAQNVHWTSIRTTIIFYIEAPPAQVHYGYQGQRGGGGGGFTAAVLCCPLLMRHWCHSSTKEVEKDQGAYAVLTINVVGSLFQHATEMAPIE